MREGSGATLKAYFLGWQCRIRQVSVRDFGGQPLPAMQPRVSGKDGTVISRAVNLLLVPDEPSASTAFFKFQVQKTNEPEQVRDAFRAAGYTPEEVEGFSKVVEGRIAQLNKL